MSVIKDFIIDVDNIENKKKEEKKKKSAPKGSYSIVTENDMDFVVKRKTTRLDKDLVIMPSQNLYYVKDNTNNSIEKITYHNVNSVVRYFLKDWDIFEKCELTKPTWIKKVNDIKTIQRMVDGYIDMSFNSYGLKDFCDRIKSRYDKELKDNIKLFRYLNEKGMTNISNNAIDYFIFISKKYNLNNAKYLIDIVDDIGLDLSDSWYSRMGNAQEILNKYNFDVNTFNSYITSSLYSQGCNCFGDAILEVYLDYLNMCYEMYGKIKNKYPDYLKTEHDKVLLKYNLWKKYKKDISILNIQESHKTLEYEDDKYCIILPKSSSDIIDEGVNMSHCVATYVDKVADGKTMILFMRSIENKDKSLVTIELKGNEVLQARGYSNRTTKDEEHEFIKKWALKNNLELKYYR